MHHSDKEYTNQVRFISNADCDESVKSTRTDKRNNLKSSKNRKKSSGVRSKFFLEGIRQELYHLQKENELLREIVMNRIYPKSLAEEILCECESPPIDIFLRSSILMEDDESNDVESDISMNQSNDNNNNNNMRMGQEIEIIEKDAPVKELLVPCQEEKFKIRNRYIDRTMKIDSESDGDQFLVDAFTSNFAY